MEIDFSNQFQSFLDMNYPERPETVMANSSQTTVQLTQQTNSESICKEIQIPEMAPGHSLTTTKPKKQTYNSRRSRYKETIIPEVPKGHPLTFCRLCFSTHSLRQFSQQHVVLSWMEYINQNVGIQLNIDQDPCFAICFGCRAGLESVSLFRDTCFKHDRALKQHRATVAAKEKQPSGGIVITNVVTLASHQPSNKVAQPNQITRVPLLEMPATDEAINLDEPQKNYEKCNACDLKIPAGAPFTKHLTKYHAGKGMLFYCSICSQRFRKAETFQLHALKHKTQRDQAPNTKNKCKICKESFESIVELSKHELEKHDLKYDCEICCGRFATEQAQAVHMLLHKAGVSVGRYFKCKMCDLIFPNSHILNAHINKHTRYYNCPMCGKTFSGIESYLEHQTVEHKDNSSQTKCTFCDVIYQSNMDLHTHLNLNHTTHDPNTEDNEQHAAENNAEQMQHISVEEMETVSLSDDDNEGGSNDDLFPTYLEADDNEAEDQAIENEMTAVSGDGLEADDELVVVEEHPEIGFDLYGTAFPQQITITLDDDSL